MIRLEDASAAGRDAERDLVDLPLRSDPGGLPVPTSTTAPEGSGSIARPLARLGSFVADAAVVFLEWAVAVLAAVAERGRTPPVAGAVWAAAFLLLLSFFATVPALLLFGRTVGMAIAGLDISERAQRPLTWREALARWLGTLATAATFGLLLAWTARWPKTPTPADRWSGRALCRKEL